MSRIVKIVGNLEIDNRGLAKEAIQKSALQGIELKEGKFVFDQYDYYEGRGKAQEIAQVETLYQELVEEQKRLHREAVREKVIENAIKQGYTLKKEIPEDNTIKLVLQKRVY